MWNKVGNRIGVWLVQKLLDKHITEDQRNTLITRILDSLGALPFKAIVGQGENGELLINNKPVPLEKLKQLREGARMVLDNQSYKLIAEQVAFTAVVMGVHKAEHPLHLIFARAALWWHQEMDKQLSTLAQRQDEVQF